MPNIFIFTAGNPIARRHLQDSVANPINREKVLSNFDSAEHENLEKIYGEGKGFLCLGSYTGSPEYSHMERDETRGLCLMRV